jgi:hypothetical protein|tara:strand:- start:404 stop:583 length:180 start_codon:yes stop_codon:yes gene_type:complete
MISTVEKEYNINNEFSSYKVTYQDGTVWKVPHNEANRHYQEILKWVAEGNTITDNGGGE